MNSIHVTPTADSKINDVDFNNLGFGTVFSDHMLVCDYKDGHWSAPSSCKWLNIRNYFP